MSKCRFKIDRSVEHPRITFPLTENYYSASDHFSSISWCHVFFCDSYSTPDIAVNRIFDPCCTVCLVLNTDKASQISADLFYIIPFKLCCLLRCLTEVICPGALEFFTLPYP